MLGVNASTIWFVDTEEAASALRGAEPDRDAAAALVAQLHPGLEVAHLGDESLSGAAPLGDGEVVAGCYPGIAVVRTGESLPPVPSSLVEHWIQPSGLRHTYLSSSSPSTRAGSWGAFAYWDDGELKRSFSATPVHIIENVGLPQVWERPFWAGDHPAPVSIDVLPDPQTLPFDPREFAEAAQHAWLGADLDPATVTVSRFAVYPAGQVPDSVHRREKERAEEERLAKEQAERQRSEGEPAARDQAAGEESVPGASTAPVRRRTLFSRLFRRDT